MLLFISLSLSLISVLLTIFVAHRRGLAFLVVVVDVAAVVAAVLVLVVVLVVFFC